MNDIIKVIQTAKDTTDRLTAKTDLVLNPDRPEKVDQIEVDTQTKYQEILGFGGALTEASAYVYSNMSSEKKSEILDAYFHPAKGLRYTICRTHMNSCDFSLGNYSCDDVPGDIELKYFNIERDRRYIIPLIKEAMKVACSGPKGKPFKMFISPWSPPGWMKTNNQMNHGGQLKNEYQQTWALFFAKFIKSYEAEGIPIWGLTVQNEPEATQTWDSCRYTAEEERDFVRDYLGPTLAKEGLGDKKIMVWDHNRDILYDRAMAILSDPKAAEYIWGLGFHWYSGDDFENLAKTHTAFPDKHLLFTEGCWEGGVKLGQWDRGERYAYHMIGDLNNWTTGWVDWNMILDHTGGPNHVGNFCDAPIIADPNTDTVYYQTSYYYIGHFSKFILPGARRIASGSTNKSLETAAFQNADGSIVVVVLNRSDKDQDFKLVINQKSAHTKSPAHSISSFILG